MVQWIEMKLRNLIELTSKKLSFRRRSVAYRSLHPMYCKLKK